MIMPIVFCLAVIDPNHSFRQYTVVAADTISAITQQVYRDSSQRVRIFQANRD